MYLITFYLCKCFVIFFNTFSGKCYTFVSEAKHMFIKKDQTQKNNLFTHLTILKDWTLLSKINELICIEMCHMNGKSRLKWSGTYRKNKSQIFIKVNLQMKMNFFLNVEIIQKDMFCECGFWHNQWFYNELVFKFKAHFYQLFLCFY